jgi:hypothetical protein
LGRSPRWSERGRWQLSKEGWALGLEAQDHDTAHALFKQVRAERGEEWGQGGGTDDDGVGALGPFDRGIFITTSVFTQQAEDQAGAPGYKPIDLIDGERLVELLIERRLGIKDVTVVDDEFFAPSR